MEIRNVSGVGQTIPAVGASVDADGTVDVPADIARELVARPEFESTKKSSKPSEKES